MITSVSLPAGKSLQFRYDAQGQRVIKSYFNGSTTALQWYVRDAQGNIMAIYDRSTSTEKLLQVYLYGTARLGELLLNRDSAAASLWNRHHYRIKGNRHYELNNHLGNVLAVVTDRKMAQDTTLNATYTPQYFLPDVYAVQNYYAFGQNMPKWSSSALNDPARYRFGMNGQEREIEINANIHSAQFWEYDARTARRWNVDPKPSDGFSWYSTFLNNPIKWADFFGDSISPERTKGMNFIIVPTREMRKEDRKSHAGNLGFLGSAYTLDYLKAKVMSIRSGGRLKVIEACDANDAVTQIVNKLGDKGFVANLVIDYHAYMFGEEILRETSLPFLERLKAGFIGKESNCYLGHCWAGGHHGFDEILLDEHRFTPGITKEVSTSLDGARTYEQQSTASTFSFVFFNHFVGPIWTNGGKDQTNIEHRGMHSVSYFDPAQNKIITVEMNKKVKIKTNGEVNEN